MPRPEISEEEWFKNTVLAAERYQAMEESGSFEPGLWGRMRRLLNGEQDLNREQENARNSFVELLRKDSFHSASVIGEEVLKDTELNIDAAAEARLMEILNNYKHTGNEKSLKKAFALLDSFEHGKKITEAGGEISYTEQVGHRLIDRLATDLWYALDGSAKAFFEKYVEEESRAEITDRNGKPLEGYKQTAEKAFRETLGQNPYDAVEVGQRFDLDHDILREAEDEIELLEWVEDIKQGDLNDLTPEIVEEIEDSKIDLSGIDTGNRYEKKIGHFLTDRYLWRTNPEGAPLAGEENIIDRLRMVAEGRRENGPSLLERRKFFQELMNEDFYQAAAAYAPVAGVDPENFLLDSVLQNVESEDYGKAFAALEAFEYQKQVSEIIQDGRNEYYLMSPGPSKLMDKVATDLWKNLDGSARAFFQMYIDDPKKTGRCLSKSVAGKDLRSRKKGTEKGRLLSSRCIHSLRGP